MTPKQSPASREWWRSFVYEDEEYGGYHVTKEQLPLLISEAIRRREEELVREIEKMKPDVNKMQHDLKGKCDFEKINTLNDVLALLRKE